MPPQKNSGNRGSKKESGVASKNRRFIQAFLEDVRKEGTVDDVYIGRVLKKMGNGRVEVFYVDSKNQPRLQQSVIRGSFRGKGKHAVWIDMGSIVAIASSGVPGSCEFEIMAVLSHDQVADISEEMNIDPRILAIDLTDERALMSGVAMDDAGFMFEGTNAERDLIEREEKNKARPKPQLEDELDIDDI